jgi:hypothetical protein
MRERQHHKQVLAAARAGMSERTARRLEQDPRKPSERQPVRGRTVADPLAEVWESDLLPMLERDPSLRPVTLLRYLQRTYPDQFPDDGVRRTLERRMRAWKARHGPPRDVVFRQSQEPGRQALSDFTHARRLAVTIAGEPLDHLLYNFVLPYSGWQFVRVVLGGESFSALSESLQDALWTLGKVPGEHRTDSLSAAFRNLGQDQQADVTARYRELCRHYGLRPSRNNPGEAHENGAVEAHNRHLKDALEQALILRGDRNFPDLASYQRFVDEVVGRRNAARQDALTVELRHMRALPRQRTTDFTEVVVSVLSTSGFWLRNVFYSVPSQLIGHRLRVHVFDARIEAYLGSTHVVTHPRRSIGGGVRKHVVDYRHVVHALKRKPQALAGLTYRDQLFPRSEYRRAWNALNAALPQKDACTRMVALLAMAHEEACEVELARLIAGDLEAGRLPAADALRRQLRPATAMPVDVPVALTDPAQFDALLPACREVTQ